MIAEDILVDLDSNEAVKTVSRSPWLNAIDSECLRSSGSVFCGGSVVGDKQTDIGHDVTIEVLSPVACSSIPTARPVRWTDDVRVVVTAIPHGMGWRVVQVRAAKRECAIYGFRDGSALGPAFESASVSLPSTAYAVATNADKVSVATREGFVVIDRAGQRLVRSGVALRDVALMSDGSPAWIDVEGNVSTFQSGRVVALAEDFDAVALTGCGTGVCWTTYDAGEVRQWRGGKTKVLASGLTEPLGIASAGGDLLIAAADGILVLRSGVSQPEAIAAAVEPVDVASHKDTLAWIEPNGRIIVRRGGERGWRQATGSIVFSGGRPASIALTDQFVFWVDAESGTLRRVTY